MQALKQTKYILIGLVTLSITACGTNEEIFELPMSAPFAEEVVFSTTKVSADSAGVYTLESGSQISLPANALVDKDGNQVKGEVDLKFREFHSADDILLSGIPMQLDADGNTYMASGGMMEIRASQNGKELELAEGKSAGIELISEVDLQNGYQLFHLEDNKTWSEGTTFERIPNIRKDSALCKLALKDSILNNTFKIQADFKFRPYIQMWEGVSWRMVSCDSKLPWNSVRDVIWESICVNPSLSSDGTYLIDIISTIHKHDGRYEQWPAKIYAKPVISDKELAKLHKKQLMSNEAYEKKLAQMKADDLEKIEAEIRNEEQMLREAEERFQREQQELARQQARFQRQSNSMSSFRVTTLGVHNIDRIITRGFVANSNSNGNVVNVLTRSYVANFDVPNEKIDRVCLLHYDEPTVLSYSPGDAIPFEVKENTAIVIVLKDGSGRKVSKEDYELKINTKTVTELEKKIKLKTDKMDIKAFTRDNAKRNFNAKFV